MSASIRLAQKRAHTERPRLQSAARREKLQAALKDAQTAVAAAQELIQGAERLGPGFLTGTWPHNKMVNVQAKSIVLSGLRDAQTAAAAAQAPVQDELHSTVPGASRDHVAWSFITASEGCSVPEYSWAHVLEEQ